MNIISDLPSCLGSSPLNITDEPKELETIIKPLSMDENLDIHISENGMTVNGNDNKHISSESSAKAKSHLRRCNNNKSDCGLDEKFKVSSENSNEKVGKGENFVGAVAKSLKKRHSKRREKIRKTDRRNLQMKDMSQPLNRINGENKLCGISSEHNLATVGGDGENEKERSRCQQHELSFSSNEINRPDVIASCDLTSNLVIKINTEKKTDQNNIGRKDCPGNRLVSGSKSQSTCSEGSYSRRKHHKHHKHKQKNKSPTRLEDGSYVTPKVNPIFLWVRQEDTRIVEVFCEDYDHRNRLRLTRTRLGWRAIPKTKRFAEAIIPRAKSKDDKLGDASIKPKQIKKLKKQNKTKRKKKVQKSNLPDNLIKECSVALYRDDLINYKYTAVGNSLPEEEESCEKDVDNESWSAPNLIHSLNSDGDTGPDQSRSPSQLSINISDNCLKKSKNLVKSNSCDFQSLKKVLENFPRSISLDFKLKRDIDDFEVKKKVQNIELNNCNSASNEMCLNVKKEPDIEKEETVNQSLMIQEKVIIENELEESNNQRNNSKSEVMDTTKQDSEFNDTDCDELGQLLKDIPDLEFVEEEELEEVDEEDEWSVPTDLTMRKSSLGNAFETKASTFPTSISPMVTVTSSLKSSEPLTAPLPEVTITPIPNPKPAHQHKTQNNFLEHLLSSSRSLTSERDKTMHKTEKKLSDSFQTEKKLSKHLHDSGFDSENKSKKLKMEDITLKNLLFKQQSGNANKPFDSEDCSKSRLHELLTESMCSDPISQLKEVLSNPHLAVPDPLLVPRARLPALVASPASEIPRLLSMHLDKVVEKTPCPPVKDSDVLEVSLSNLQSLLSCSPDKLSAVNTQDLSNHQKSLETFLEWQRYQAELMDAQLKGSKSLSSGFPNDIADVAAATAFSQMFWLPYLNQLEFNCNANRDFNSFMSTILTHDYQSNSNNLTAPPQINISQVPQPSPFLTPTSPMDIESHLKTLAMWQEAVMMQQNSQSSRTCPKVSTTKTSPDIRKNNKMPNVPHSSSLKKQLFEENQLSFGNANNLGRGEPYHNNHYPFEVYQDGGQNEYQKKNKQNIFQRRLEEHQKQLEYHKKYKLEQQNQFRKMQKNYSNYQAELLRQGRVSDKKKCMYTPGNISVKPLSNLIDSRSSSLENKKSWEKIEEELRKNTGFSNQSAKYYQLHSQVQKNKIKEDSFGDYPSQVLKSQHHSEKQNFTGAKSTSGNVPKLKVKNLVDPNMSPPKLLKQIAPEHLPIVMEDQSSIQDESQAQLWHPLYGSNQIKPHPYNSPWRWTTVTVNGE